MKEKATTDSQCLLSSLRSKMEEKYLSLGACPGEENALVGEFFHRIEDAAYHFMLLATRDEQKAHIIGNLIIPRLDEIAAQYWLEEGHGSGLDDTEAAGLIGTALIELLKSIPDQKTAATEGVVGRRYEETEFRASAFNRLTGQYDEMFKTRFSALLAKGRCREKAEERNKFITDKFDYDTSRIILEKRNVTTSEFYGPWEPVSEEV